jgi:hypothetical protein
MPAKHIHTRRIVLSVVALCLAVAGALASNIEYRRIMDTYTLAHADPGMVALAGQAGMSRQGKLVFLRTKPQLVSDSEMQADCAQNTTANNKNGFIEQGCYSPPTNRIYIRRMPTDLQKLEATTAAYEMLHPVYISLHHGSQGRTLDAAIEANYTYLHDTKLTAQVANFASTEPGARDLELFSLIGTGYTNLSDDLAQFYAPYFGNRNATVNATHEIDQRFQQYQDQLSQLRSQIDSFGKLAEQAYATSVTHARAGDAAGNDQYYSQYRQYLKQENAAINQYNSVLKNYNALVTEYNGTQPVNQINPAQTQSQ